jgi:benzodiazapine receptor
MNESTTSLPPVHRWWGAAIFVLGCQLAGAVGAATTETGGSTWYAALAKPSFQPPGWVFGPVWITLYTLMGIAAWRVWERREQSPAARRALGLFLGQLVLNAVWTPVFFGAHKLGLALAILLALAGTVALTIHAFRRVDRVAAWMLAPYLLWVLFASVLNAAIVWLN